MNTDLHFSSKSNEWATPQQFFDELNKEFRFTLDPCATKENAKCKKFFTEKNNGLIKSWDNEIVFCNPPYGKGLKDWVKKASEAEGGGSCNVNTCKNRHTILSLLHIQKEECRNTFLKRETKVRRFVKLSSFPLYGCSIQVV